VLARPHFLIPVRPIDIPSELLALPPETEVLYTTSDVVGRGQGGTLKASELIESIEETIKRQAAGWFYLREAAQIVADAWGINAWKILGKMNRAIVETDEKKKLSVRDTDSKMRRDPGEECHPWDTFVTPFELNDWLERDGTPHRFPAASSASATNPAPSEPLQDARQPDAQDSASVSPAHGSGSTGGRRRSGPTVQDAIAPYVAQVMQKHPDYTAERLQSHMKREAGQDNSPFSRPTQGGELFCFEAGKACGLSSVRAALTRYHQSRLSRRGSTVDVPSNP
ncbi:MAG: hypothetical protein AB9M53_06645, partial [Leptothrix sp. (in: b-proteobacteria)]